MPEVAHVEIHLTLFCDHTTELGHDEVYVNQSLETNSASSLDARVPGGTDCWDMNDDGEGSRYHQVGPVLLGVISLRRGESAKATIKVRESDNDGNQDDDIGSVQVAIVADDAANLTVNWTPLNDITFHEMLDANTFNVRMVGSGSSYKGLFATDIVSESRAISSRDRSGQIVYAPRPRRPRSRFIEP